MTIIGIILLFVVIGAMRYKYSPTKNFEQRVQQMGNKVLARETRIKNEYNKIRKLCAPHSKQYLMYRQMALVVHPRHCDQCFKNVLDNSKKGA